MFLPLIGQKTIYTLLRYDSKICGCEMILEKFLSNHNLYLLPEPTRL